MHAVTLISLVSSAAGLLALLGGVRLWRSGRRATRRWSRRGRLAGAALSFTLSLGALGSGVLLYWYSHRPVPAPSERRLFEHVTYRRDVRHSPRPLVIHQVRVELGQPGIRFFVTPGSPKRSRQLRARTTSSFLRTFGLQLAVNGQVFYPWDKDRETLRGGEVVNVNGLNASRGVIYAQATSNHPTLFISEDNQASIGKAVGPIYNAISGHHLLVAHGRLQIGSSTAEQAEPEPRTAVGIDRQGRQLLIVVVDGRQPNYSEGMTLHELARLLVSLGAHEAMTFDGGGSSALVIEGSDGQPLLLNSPIDRRIPGRERVVANHLGLYARPVNRAAAPAPRRGASQRPTARQRSGGGS